MERRARQHVGGEARLRTKEERRLLQGGLPDGERGRCEREGRWVTWVRRWLTGPIGMEKNRGDLAKAGIGPLGKLVARPLDGGFVP
ncbi:hypothetical protein [Candidatus Methylacidithermus pantelleriae]|uniref:Uncharacterized protein n=1 Tax=Candidatus Methylacidithermus pantelleriae TaxID=2744239 RepID=A0A8J2FR89_9BACT|nr:hypothetical protein [Candidatus Methylacidithermus pantelleriae]CAF0689172.1 hypothetical protein MPNT_10134 [Candidatus Methylacidithermus pantelleriae]